MNIKDIIYNTVLSNLHKPSIRDVYDKAITLVSSIKDRSLTVYVRVYSYNGFTRFIKTDISKEVFTEIAGDDAFSIPVTGYGNEYSIEYRVYTLGGTTEYIEAGTEQPNLDIYNKLMSYEREMLHGNS